MLLTSSIRTIKGIRAGGVPKGTKWAIIALGSFTQPITMWPSQSGRAKLTVRVR